MHQSLMKEVPIHHHVPSSIKALILSLYDNFQKSITTDNFTTPAIHVDRCVLQGLLLYVCFNTFIQSLSKRNTNNSISFRMILSIDSNLQMTQP